MEHDWMKLFEIVDDFMDETHMQWNHGDWLSLLSKVNRAGLIMDPDELGKLIERERERRLKKIN
jgi:hypothetical protein